MAEPNQPRKVQPWPTREQDRAWASSPAPPGRAAPAPAAPGRAASPSVAPERAAAPQGEQRGIRPPWPTSTLPAWIGGGLVGFGILMLILYPWAVLTPHASAHWAIYFIAIVGSLIVGVSSTRRTRREILTSDGKGYTMRVDYVRPKGLDTPLVKPRASQTPPGEAARGSEIVLPGGTRVVSPPPPGWASAPARKRE